MITNQFITINGSDEITASKTDLTDLYQLVLEESEPFGPRLAIKASASTMNAIARAIRAVVPDEEPA